ncbi:MAG: hypothetical protein ABIO71_12030 [Caldimonas sp.]
MLYMLLVFAHLLAASMALGAIVATDLRLLSKLSQDRLRIAPPNEFVARIVMVALLMLYVTGGGIVALGVLERPDYLSNPKLQAKVLFVVLLTLNAFVLHRLTFPRLARGRRVARWHAADWILVAVPVAVSNFLWMFVAFLGIARPWNYAMPLRDILEIGAALYVVAQVGVFAILAMAGSSVEPDKKRLTDTLRRSLASVGSLGRPVPVQAAEPGRSRSRSRRAAEAVATLADAGPDTLAGAEPGQPALRLVGSRRAR